MSATPADPSSSWLSSLRAGRPAGWERLVFVFAPVVRAWCRQAGLQEADADEVTQTVFVNVRQGIAGFVQGNFVGWLYTITRHAILDHIRQRDGNPPVVGGSDFADRLAQEPAPEAESEVPEPARLVALRRAMDVVKRDVQAQTWRAFEMVVIEEKPTAEVAETLGMAEANVRNAKSRVMARIREELGADS